MKKMEPSVLASTGADGELGSKTTTRARPPRTTNTSTGPFPRRDCIPEVSGPPRPSHYSRLRPQPVEVIEAWGLGWHLGNALKYIARAGHKDDELRDLRKALWFIRRRLQVREAEMDGAPTPPPEDQE